MRQHSAPARRDEGSAMIITLLALALVTALASTVSVLAIDNLQSSRRAQQAGASIDAADAGVSQAMSYLRSSGVRGLRCSPSCTANAWGNSGSPMSVTLPDGSGEYRVWIEPVRPFPANDPGVYRIHSTGVIDSYSSRSVLADVDVTTSEVPKGLFAKSFTGGGSASVTRESVFSTGCIWERSKIHTVTTNPEAPQNLDAAYGIPVGVHTSNYITDANGSAQYCSTSESKLIHKSGSGKNAAQTPCSASYPYDQDKLGGAATSACSTVQRALATKYPGYYSARDLNGDGSTDVTGSYLKDDASLLSLFDLKADPFTDAELDDLRTIAESQGNYWTSSAGWDTPDETNAVMFFDLEGSDLGGTVDLNDFRGTAFSRSAGIADDDTCPTTSLLIVIVGGNVKVNSHTQMAASIFLTSPAPYGQVVKANGTADFIGTIYADKINLVGNFDASLDACFLANASPALLSLSVGSYREEDRGLS